MRIRTPTELGLLIREQRRKLGLDQQTLSTRVGVSRQWLIEMEQGKPRAELSLVLRTLAALGLQLDLAESHESRKLEQQARPSKASATKAKASVKHSKSTARSPHAQRSSGAMIDLDAVIERARGRQSKS